MKLGMENLNNEPDIVLINRYQSGNKEVLTVLVKRWHLQFCKLAYWYCNDKDISKDIAQESWLIIFNKLNDLQQPEKFKSWAISIVNRKAIDWIRKTKREHRKLHRFYDETPKNVVNNSPNDFSKELLQQMKLEILKLSKNQQIVLQLFYLEEQTLKQIASLLNISIGTAKSRLFHAREKLKSQLKI